MLETSAQLTLVEPRANVHFCASLGLSGRKSCTVPIYEYASLEAKRTASMPGSDLEGFYPWVKAATRFG
jgi:hypothetical protein